MKRFILLALFLLSGLSVSLAADHRVMVSDTQFTPRIVHAAVGDTITWVLATGATGHIVSSVTIPPGAEPWDQRVDADHPTYQIQLTTAGLYRYHCRIHLFMKGMLKVSQ